MSTLPNASCVLHAEGASNPSMKLFADEEGTVRFYVRPTAESDNSAKFQVDCTSDNQTATFPLQLRPNSSPTADMPAPAAEVRKEKPGAYVRPALTQADAMNLSKEELGQKGYPVRPDPAQAPDAFANWIKAVTKPSTFVPPHLAANPDVTHSRKPANPAVTNSTITSLNCAWLGYCNESSGNWSGIELRGPAYTYDFVIGEWTVPAVSWESNQNTYSAFWVGLDGDGTNDLVQDGTEQEISEFYYPSIGLFVFTNYYAWTEVLPMQPYEQVVSNFTVTPGDTIFAEAYVGTPGNPTLTAAYPYGILYIEDLTRNEHTTVYNFLTGTGTYVGGSEAEWIMERPTHWGVLPDLADYSTATMFDAYAYTTSGQWVSYDKAFYENVSMVNGYDLLSSASPVSTGQMRFTWYNWH